MIKLVFFGTPTFSAQFLASLHSDNNFSISALICQPDKPIGRKKIITPPATKIFAEANNIPIFQPKSLRNNTEIWNNEALQDIDIFVVVAYGKIIPQNILDIPKFGTINVHPSLLPKYRGPSPIQSAIVNQDKETGISIMLLDAGMDSGPILNKIRLNINSNETPETLKKKIVTIGAPLLKSSIKDYISKKIEPQTQNNNQATICKLLTRKDGIINWNHDAQKIDAQIRAYTPWPGSFTTWKGKTLKIHQVQISDIKLETGLVVIQNQKLLIGTKTTALEILELQIEGKQKMNAKTFINGFTKINNTILL